MGWVNLSWAPKLTLKSSAINRGRLTEIISFKEIAYKHRRVFTQKQRTMITYIFKSMTTILSFVRLCFLHSLYHRSCVCFDKLIVAYDGFFLLSMFIFVNIWDCISDVLLTFISCVTVSWMLSHYISCRCYFYIKRIHHVKALYVWTNEKHFPKTLSQLEFLMACLQKYRN